MMTFVHVRRGFSITLITIAFAACSAADDSIVFDPLQFQERTGVVFVAQNVVPEAVMEALFEGRVVADQAGCLRLDSPDPATVVWPKGFRISESGGTLRIRDATGRDVGDVGGTFRLGGGEVQALHEGIGVSAADRQRAETHCPGRYWIVGDVL